MESDTDPDQADGDVSPVSPCPPYLRLYEEQEHLMKSIISDSQQLLAEGRAPAGFATNDYKVFRVLRFFGSVEGFFVVRIWLLSYPGFYSRWF